MLHNSDSTFACLKTAKNQNNPFFKANIEELYFVPISMLLVLLYGSLSVSGAASLKNHNSNLNHTQGVIFIINQLSKHCNYNNLHLKTEINMFHNIFTEFCSFFQRKSKVVRGDIFLTAAQQSKRCIFWAHVQDWVVIFKLACHDQSIWRKNPFGETRQKLVTLSKKTSFLFDLMILTPLAARWFR